MTAECVECGSEFDSERAYKVHYGRAHGGPPYPWQMDGEHECPTCGRSDFASDTGLKIHHSQAHGESIAGEPVDCGWCGASLRRPPSRIERGENNFCDADCRSAYLSEHQSGLNHHQNKRTREVCERCDEEYLARPENAGRFCSRECSVEWLTDVQTGEDHPLWSRETRECFNCGEEITERPSYFEGSERHFCSMSCRAEVQPEWMQGEKNPAWKGGEVSYGPNWPKMRRKALERGGWECRCCGMDIEAHRDRWGKELHVHHIVPAREFDDPEERNRLDNLVTLCSECHKKAEHADKEIWS